MDAEESKVTQGKATFASIGAKDIIQVMEELRNLAPPELRYVCSAWLAPEPADGVITLKDKKRGVDTVYFSPQQYAPLVIGAITAEVKHPLPPGFAFLVTKESEKITTAYLDYLYRELARILLDRQP